MVATGSQKLQTQHHALVTHSFWNGNFLEKMNLKPNVFLQKIRSNYPGMCVSTFFSDLHVFIQMMSWLLSLARPSNRHSHSFVSKRSIFTGEMHGKYDAFLQTICRKLLEVLWLSPIIFHHFRKQILCWLLVQASCPHHRFCSNVWVTEECLNHRRFFEFLCFANCYYWWSIHYKAT